MNTMKTLPILATVAVLALGSGTFLAVAQDSGTETAVTQSQDETRGGERRGERHAKAHGRHGHHMRGHGRRGGRHGGMMREVFQQADADGDRTLTRDEIGAFRTSLVAQADAGGDGALSIDEFDIAYRQLTRPQMVRAFQRLDRDGDGIISAVEMDRTLDRMVQRMDRNGDGVLTMEDRRRGKR